MSLLKDSRGRLLIFILAILFSACSGGIDSTYTQLQDHTSPVYDSAGKQVSNIYKLDTMLTLSPSFSQKIRITKHIGVFGWAMGLVFLAWVIIVIAIIYSNGGGRWKGAILVGALAWLVLHAAAFSLVDSAHTKQSAIKKTTYDSLMQTPNGLKPYWDENLLK